ncbi:ATP-binding protein [Parapedobacter sp. GCM10030251]|uniref:sensor histidine kinase n=1 Tax=Parapedobacter sp. GCM10030251 TaxID=3273419 RepID=UPI00361900A2
MTLLIASIRRAFFLALTALLTSPYTLLAADGTFNMAHYTDEHGLPQNSIKGIGQDNLGFIWLISEKGPIRYDGQGRFKTFPHLSGILKTVRLNTLSTGERPHELWARSESGEVVLLQDGKAQVLQEFPHRITSSFALRYKENTHYHLSSPTPYPGDRPSHVFVPDGAGGGFVVSSDSVLRIGNDGSITASIAFPSASPWRFNGFNGKLFYFNSTLYYVEIGSDLTITKRQITGDILQLPSGTRFDVYWNTTAHQLFIYAAESLYRLTEHANGNLTSTRILTGFNFKTNHIVSAFYHASGGQLLLGSATKGLFIFKQAQFTTLSVDDQYSKTVFYNQTPLPGGLLATDQGITFDDNGEPHFSQIVQPGEPKYGQILGPDGNLWILQTNRILVVTPSLDRVVGTKSLSATPSLAFKGDSSDYWLGTKQGTLLKYDADADTFRAAASFSSGISYIERKADGALFVGTDEGLFVFDTTKGSVLEVPFFKGKQIRSIRNESDRRYWVTTYQHGFFLYADGKATAFPLDNNHYLATAHCTLEDRNGFLWISTNKGLFKVSKRQLLHYRDDPQQAPFYFYYDKQWGFNTNEFNGGCEPCAIELPNGRFSFPSLDGLVQFDPAAITDAFPSGTLILDEIALNGKSLPVQDTIQIPQHFSRLDLKIATPFYGNPHTLHMEYLLYSKHGKPNEWLPLNGSDDQLSFNELPAGNHEIRVRMRTDIGPEAFHYTTFHLYKTPLFHETAWFIAISFVLAGLGIWFIMHSRSRLILRQNRLLVQKVNERTAALASQYEWQQRLSTSITHDIKAPLNYVVKALSNMQEIAKQQGFLPSEMEQIYLSTKNIYLYSNNLTTLAKFMLAKDQLNVTDVPLYQTAQRQIDIFQSVAISRGNTIHNRIPKGTVIQSHAEILPIIIHNLLDNAIKFTLNGEITVQAQRPAADTLSLSISDTGVGLYPEQIAYYNRINQHESTVVVEEKKIGFGLLLVKDMAHLIGAEMMIQSTLGQGTTVSFIFRQHGVS